MPTIKEIKNRRNTIESTSQITKAMKLVATVKLQHTKDRAQNSIPYFDTMYDTVTDILKKSSNVNHMFTKPSGNGKVALIVISGNRGLAGGYNSNIIRTLTAQDAKVKFDPNDTLIYAVGGKARDGLKRKGFVVENDYSDWLQNPTFDDAYQIANDIIKDYKASKIREIYLCYTFFKNTVVHIPRVLKLIPFTSVDDHVNRNEDTNIVNKNSYNLTKSQYASDDSIIMNYEPTDDELLDLIVPKYITSIIYGAMTSSIASENGARMTAMDNATNNANELIDKLSIQYNRARQGAITQELTEIIAGANAI